MKKSATYLLLTVCALGAAFLSSCRDLGDDLLSYGQNDTQAFDKADKSYAAQFEAFWTAMNENYCIWDFEEKMGLNWDEVYKTYMPRFQELDDTTRHIRLTDDEFRAIYAQFLDSLHDGHTTFQIKNLSTGNYVVICPCTDRNLRERGERYMAEHLNITNLNAYRTDAVDARYRVESYQSASSYGIILTLVDSTAQRLIRGTADYIAAVDAAGGPDELNDSVYTTAKRLQVQAQIMLGFVSQSQAVIKEQLVSFCQQYNDLRNHATVVCRQIGVEMPQLEPELVNDKLGFIDVALFPGNVAYIRLGGFALTNYFEPEKSLSDTTSFYYAYHMAVLQVWQSWFDAIQTHYAAGDLGGVIFDVRNNGGGMVSDYQYFLGALLPSGGWESHTLRVKNGSGRLDFAPLTPFVVSTYSQPHAIITEQPIVVLANSNSVSLSENTTWGVISQPNGYFIGTRTYGGLSALSASPEDYSSNYSGTFGVQDVTSFYGYVPKFVCLYDEDLHIVESVGFSPDEDLPLDVQLWTTQGRDNQLERALDYIHSK